MAATYRERLWAAAIATRDMMVHGDAARWEIFAKASTVCETVVCRAAPPRAVRAEETGVAVRSSRDEQSGFGAASGLGADASRRAVEAARAALLPTAVDPLPPARLLGAVEAAAPREAPGQGWAEPTAAAVGRAVQAVSGGRLELRRTVIQEGTYSWLLTTAEGFVAAHESCTTSVVAEVSVTGEASGVWREWLHVPDPETFSAEAAAGLICGRGLLTASTPTTRSGSWDAILHSEVSAQVMLALTPLFLASPMEDDELPAMLDRNGMLGSDAVSVVDDRSGVGLPVSGPCDGEGLPARRTLLVDRGVPRHRLASYRDAVLCGEAPRGGAVRFSYRDYPRTGVANLRILTDEGVTPADLLDLAPRCVYLLRPLAPVTIDPASDSYRILASAVWLEGGRIAGWQPVVELRGGIGQLLRRIEAVGTDLRWYQTEGGFVGAPSLLTRRQTVVG